MRRGVENPKTQSPGGQNPPNAPNPPVASDLMTTVPASRRVNLHRKGEPQMLGGGAWVPKPADPLP